MAHCIAFGAFGTFDTFDAFSSRIILHKILPLEKGSDVAYFSCFEKYKHNNNKDSSSNKADRFLQQSSM
jgi:hypothetical protein